MEINYLEGKTSGACRHNLAIAESLGGKAYTTLKPSMYGSEHTIALVAPNGTNKAAMIDITKVPPVEFDAVDIRKEGKILQFLETVFGVDGWGRIR